jgi:spore maturation protein CgeB
MRFALFYHSLYSDWNHGNAHFLRGIARELQGRGHDVRVYEPEDGWSLQNLLTHHGERPVTEFRLVYPTLRSNLYDGQSLDLDTELDDVDVVLVHEWNEPELVSRIGRHRAAHGGYVLLFHDTHHRSVTAPAQMERYDLQHYDGALVFGEVIRKIYHEKGWADPVWTWHEAADSRLFRPVESAGVPENPVDPVERTAASLRDQHSERDLVWIGNWGDEERTRELMQYLVEPVRQLKLDARVHGVRYPAEGRRALADAGIEYGGWLANYRVPQAFAESRITMHIPRRPYRERLHGIPTIRVFEALACGIPLVCMNWKDSEGLFTPGYDYLVADTPRQMTEALRTLLVEPELSRQLTRHGLATVRTRHTCRHRIDELLAIVDALRETPRNGSAQTEHSRQSASMPPVEA